MDLTVLTAIIATGYLFGSSLLLRRQLAAATPSEASMRQHARARGLGVLLLPELLLLGRMVGLAGVTNADWWHFYLVVLPVIGLALWIFAPRYITSKVVPLALVGVGLWGIVQDKLGVAEPTLYWSHHWAMHYGFSADFQTGPVATLVQAWAFIAVGLLLTWLRMDPRSRPSQLVLREPARVRGRGAAERGRPRWGLVLLILAVLLFERLPPVLVWHPAPGPLFWIAQMAVIVFAVAFVVFRFPAVAGDLAIAGLIAFGVDGIEIARTMSGSWSIARPVAYGMYLVVGDGRWTMLAGAEGVALVAAGVWLLPRALDDRTKSLFWPSSTRELARRVTRLTQTRADAVDSAAAELRRVERDLHDGAQARLVALGIILRGAERLIHDSPDAAAALVAEARESSLTALGELRDLVRGIRPPVLADRGLADAVQALALDTPLHTQVDVDLPGRPDLAVESACYFAVAELLANAVKHSGARQAHVQISHDAGVLLVTVTDDGAGGADPARGTGLAGLERRLATFDGVLAVSSPPGGPTIAAIEVPCALSSLKTSTC